MLTQPHTLTKGVAAVLAACALLPAAAGAVPADVHSAGPPKVVHQTPRSLAAPDQIDRIAESQAPTTANVLPPTAAGLVKTSTANVLPPTAAGLVKTSPPRVKVTAPSDGGSDIGLILGLSGGALLLFGGLGLVSRKQIRQGQPA
jgi:hypothetical protein